MTRPSLPKIASTISATAAALICAFASAEPPASAGDSNKPKADSLQQQVEQAYARTRTYQSTVTYKAIQQDGRWKRTRQTEVEIAFDRSNRKLSIDRPSVLVNADGGGLRLNIAQIEDRYLSKPLTDQPLSLSTLTDTLPALGQPAFPDLLMLLSDSPWQAMVGKPGQSGASADGANTDSTLEVKEVGSTSDGSDHGAMRRLKVRGETGVMTLDIDPKTHLIRKAQFEVDAKATGMADGDSMHQVFDIDVHSRNQSLDDKAFAFNPGQAKAVSSLSELAGSGHGGPPGTGGRDHPLKGKQAPPISLTQADGSQFKLKNVDADVVVIDFWATWCAPCRIALPHLQAVADWAKENDKSVAVYTVNVRETAKQAKAFWKKADLSMPILMDTQSKVAEAYRVRAFPLTVLIKGDTVKEVHVGLRPKGKLKEDVQALLANE